MTGLALEVNNTNMIRSFSDEAKPPLPSSKDKPKNRIETSIQVNSERKRQEKKFRSGILHELSKELNTYLEDHQISMGFFIHKKLNNQIVVEIKNRETGELVRQVPSEELLRIREGMVTSTGLIFNTIG